MKIIFAGTPEFAATALLELLRSSHSVIAIYTQPDRPSGRGLKLTPSPVKEIAQIRHIPLHQPASLKSPTEQQTLADYQADVMVVAAYGMLLPDAVLRIPKFGCINIHPSLLPRWRGAAPIQRTIFAGDKTSGVSIMQMDTGLDTGPVLLQKHYVLSDVETSQTLHDKLAVMGGELLVESLNLLEKNQLTPKPQDNQHTTYASKISKEEALIDWMLPAIDIERMVRAFNPRPVAYTSWHGQNLRIWNAKAIMKDHHATPRTILKASREGIDIATGSGVLTILQVQLPGGKVMPVSDFYNARQHDLEIGKHFL